MKKTIFLYSGEGTRDSGSRFTLLKYSKYWSEIEAILRSKLNIDLEQTWKAEAGRHQCPQSPLLTVATQICLSDLWSRWGYRPDAVLGHSIGELSAAFQAGLYSLEEVLLLTHKIGEITSRLDGTMLHGKLSDEQLEDLPVNLSAFNFLDGAEKHVTLTGYSDELHRFEEEHPDFVEMRLPHPWHHPDYSRYLDELDGTDSREGTGSRFVSGVTASFEKQLAEDHWKRWIVHPIDFIGAVQAIKNEYGEAELDIIEIGFHPVLDICCRVFDDYTYVSSMFRGEDEAKWIVHQRKQLDQAPFLERLQQTVDRFRPGLDFSTSLAYQGFTSLTFVEFTEVVKPYFPSLAPQDFYRFKTVDQLINQFGVEQTVASPSRVQVARNEVAIAGMSCRFPASVQKLTQFWEMLTQGGDQVASNSGRGDSQAGYLNDEITRFDHSFFNIPEAEAKTMDPQQILALELTELLWRDAGIDPQTLDRRRVGVYIGTWIQEYLGDKNSVYYPTGTNPSIIASRISYHYDLRGPSWVSNTACSSSLMAVHYAAKDIEAGRVDYAIAGGVNMILGNDFTDNMRNSGFLSADNRCKAFDDSANGYVRAEGGGLVLLVNKSLVEKYYARVAGSSINQNGGRAQVITAPHPEAQEELIHDACLDAGIEPRDIGYIECHGTGTKIGDPIEISAIQNTVARDRADTLHLGSVKSNMGHLESAAGIAGLIKSVLILNHGQIPPNLHFNTPNTFIDFNTLPLNVVTEETPIDRQANIGVSSFGFGGSNAHIIVKGVETEARKDVRNLEIPFDRDRAPALAEYFQLIQETVGDGQTQSATPPGEDIGEVITTLFRSLTDISEIDPEVGLLEQGLDSMSATELVHHLEQEFGIDLDPDILFNYPLLDDLVGAISAKVAGGDAPVAIEDLKSLAN